MITIWALAKVILLEINLSREGLHQAALQRAGSVWDLFFELIEGFDYKERALVSEAVGQLPLFKTLLQPLSKDSARKLGEISALALVCFLYEHWDRLQGDILRIKLSAELAPLG